MDKTKNKKNPHQLMNDTHENHRLSPLGYLFRFIGWWFGCAGLYAAFSVCPFCGQQGCPVGFVSAGSVGAFMVLCVQDWKTFFSFLKGKMKRHNQNPSCTDKI